MRGTLRWHATSRKGSHHVTPPANTLGMLGRREAAAGNPPSAPATNPRQGPRADRVGSVIVGAVAGQAIACAGLIAGHGPVAVITLCEVAAPEATLRCHLNTLPIGMGLLAPSLWLLFKVFKSELLKPDQS
jgi:hypothetical protein